MPSTIKYEDVLIRINPNDAYRLDYSRNEGRTWMHLYGKNSSTGEFEDLFDNGKELLARTTKGLFYSHTRGRTWTFRSRN